MDCKASKKNKIKVLFLTQTLGGGGAERVLVNLVNNMDLRKYEITVMTLFGDGINAKRLNKDINYVSRRKKVFRGISRIAAYIPVKTLYKHYVGTKNYDVVIAYMHGITTRIILGAPKGTKKITWIHCGDMKNASIFNCFINFSIAKKLLKKLDAIVCVSDFVKKQFIEYTGITNNIFTCYNTSDVHEIIKMSHESISTELPKDIIICSVGRFTEEKGFERLIKISKQLNEEGYSHTLLLIGDGILFNELKSKVEETGYKKVVFTGFKENPYALMARSDIFVCGSYYEGLSTATTEALILGLPIVSTDVSGAEEILGENDDYGLIVENSESALTAGIKIMIKNVEKIGKEKKIVRSNAQKFFPETTVGKVEKLIDKLQ